MKKYSPERGDLVWVNLDPTVGHEQKGRRPLLVISPSTYNETTGMLVGFPISSHDKGYRFEVPMSDSKLFGVIQVDQIRTIDWKTRKIKFIKQVTGATLREVQALVIILITQS